MFELFGRLARFGLTGLINTGVGFAIIAGLDLGLGVQPQIANLAGYAVASVVGYLLNRTFVFRSREAVGASGPRYVLAIGLAFLLNQAVLFVAGHILGAAPPARLIAQLLGMATYTVTQFLLCHFWVFARRRD